MGIVSWRAIVIGVRRAKVWVGVVAGVVTFGAMADAFAARPRTALTDDGRGTMLDGRSLPRRDAAVWRAPADARTRAAWRRMTDAFGPAWTVWEPTTNVPRQIAMRRVAAPGTASSATAAERFADDVLAQHVAVLAPGSDAADFVLVAHDDAGAIRSLGYLQYDDGRRVVGGQLSLRFSNDRLVAITSAAWPFVHAPRSPAPVDHDAARSAAEAFITADVPGIVRADAVDGPVVLPIAGGRGIEYREAWEVTVEVDAPRSRFTTWIDTSTGDPIARRQTLMFGAGTLLYDVPDRYPLAGRTLLPAANADIAINGTGALTNPDGTLFFVGANASVLTGLTGPLVHLINAMGENAAALVTVPDGSAAVWGAPDDEAVDAQLAAFVFAGIVKEYVGHIADDLPWLDEPVLVTVNIDDECNAFSDGDTINFYRGSPSCENTGRIADVVYHEFGHSVHHQSLIPGVGSFDVALSEGTSDYLAATITGDAGMGRGFFHDHEPLRNIDPPGTEHRWPDDNGEVHYAGLIIGGALWDLRKEMIAKHGSVQGVRITDRIWYEATRRAQDIPSMYLETLLVDDDDGDLSNGTPNVCEINAAYGPHGLFSPGEDAEQIVHTVTAEGDHIELLLALPNFPDCPVAATARLEHRLRDAPDDIGVIQMAPTAGGFAATLPVAPMGSVVQYRVVVSYTTGSDRSLPDNIPDPWYELFVGPVEPIWCTSFDDAAADWSLASPWRAAAPPMLSSVDPTAAFGADPFVLGTQLDGVGEYPPFVHAVASSPAIAIPAGYAAVRLHYRRWLTVEDGYFDQAWIDVDGITRWSNYASVDEKLASVHHRDREWRFHDVDLTEDAADGSITLALGLQTDAGLQFGGWTIDELCVMGVPASVLTCGNGILEGSEECDDANVAAADGCDPQCRIERDDGDDRDDDELPDTDSDSDGIDPSLDDAFVPRGCVCTTSPHRNPSPPLFAMIAIAIAVARRRRDRRS